MKKSELRQIIREELYAELSENEQLDEISLKQGALAALLALASFTGKAQDKVYSYLDSSQVANITTLFNDAYKKSGGDEEFKVEGTGKDAKVGGEFIKTMSVGELEELIVRAFGEKYGGEVFRKGSPELEQKIDSLQQAHGPEAQWKEVFKMNYLAPIENKSDFEKAFAEAWREGMKTFKFGNEIYKVEMDTTGTHKSGEVKVTILPVGERVKVNPQNESKLRNIVREVLMFKGNFPRL